MEIREVIARALMKAHGFDENNPNHSLEWDESSKESNYSMMLEDADTVISAIMSAQEEEEKEPEALLGVVRPQSTAVTKNGILVISMTKSLNAPLCVSDVRAWLEAVDDTGISDVTQIEGELYLSYDVPADELQIRSKKRSDHHES